MKKPLPIYLLPSDRESLSDIAKKEGVTMSALVNQLIKARIKKEFK